MLPKHILVFECPMSIKRTNLGGFSVSYALLKIPYSRAVAEVSFIRRAHLTSAIRAASNSLPLSCYVKKPGTDITRSFSSIFFFMINCLIFWNIIATIYSGKNFFIPFLHFTLNISSPSSFRTVGVENHFFSILTYGSSNLAPSTL